MRSVKITCVVYSHHHADHIGASSLFDKNVTRIANEETRRLLLRDNDPARPQNDEPFQDRRTLEIGGEHIELVWQGANHTPDKSSLTRPTTRRSCWSTSSTQAEYRSTIRT